MSNIQSTPKSLDNILNQEYINSLKQHIELLEDEIKGINKTTIKSKSFNQKTYENKNN